MFVIREVFERGRRGDAEADWREEEETRDGGNSLPGGGGVYGGWRLKDFTHAILVLL